MAIGAPLSTSVRARRMLRKGWAQMAKVQGNRTASILRYTSSGTPDPTIGDGGTQALVAGLADLIVVVDGFALKILKSVTREEVQLGEGERLFFFLDIPAAGGVAANTLQASDFILSDGKKWRPVGNSIANDPNTSHTWCRASVVDRG